MKLPIKTQKKILTKNFIFFSIPILISLLSFVCGKYNNLLNEKKVELKIIRENIGEDLYKRNVALNRNIVQEEYLQLYQKILVKLQKRKVYKKYLLDNLFTINDDSKSSIITQLKIYGKEISVNLGENLIYSEDNFDFKIPSNKNMTIALETEYEQNKELINCLKENKLSEKYSELDNKLLTYITATSISSRDSLNTSSDQISFLNYEDEEVEKVKQQVKEIEENKLENFYIFLMVVLVIAISYLIFVSISKRYFTTD